MAFAGEWRQLGAVPGETCAPTRAPLETARTSADPIELVGYSDREERKK